MKRREPLQFDLTPLIDVVFILIIFFIVTSSFNKEQFALSLTLPTTQGAKKEQTPKITLIELGENQLAFNGEPIDFVTLQYKLERITNKKEPIKIQIDKNVPYNRVVSLLDILQLNELSNLLLITNQ